MIQTLSPGPRQFGTDPLSEPMNTFFQVDQWNLKSNGTQQQNNNKTTTTTTIHFRIMTAKWRAFCSGSVTCWPICLWYKYERVGDSVYVQTLDHQHRWLPITLLNTSQYSNIYFHVSTSPFAEDDGNGQAKKGHIQYHTRPLPLNGS